MRKKSSNNIDLLSVALGVFSSLVAFSIYTFAFSGNIIINSAKAETYDNLSTKKSKINREINNFISIDIIENKMEIKNNGSCDMNNINMFAITRSNMIHGDISDLEWLTIHRRSSGNRLLLDAVKVGEPSYIAINNYYNGVKDDSIVDLFINFSYCNEQRLTLASYHMK